MKCSNCGNELNSGESFCSNCGTVAESNSSDVKINNQLQDMYINDNLINGVNQQNFNQNNNIDIENSINESANKNLESIVENNMVNETQIVDSSNQNLSNNLVGVNENIDVNNDSMKRNNKKMVIILICFIVIILLVVIFLLLTRKNKSTTSINESNLKETLIETDKEKNKVKDDNSLTIGKEKYYILKDNGDYLTVLKAEPLTVQEINDNRIGKDGINHVNRYTGSSTGISDDFNGYGYGRMTYYSSETCGEVNNIPIDSSCITSYDQSDIKYVVDAWASEKFTDGELATDKNGYKARLITKEELEVLGYDKIEYYAELNANVPTWVYNSNYWYWTMSQTENSSADVWLVSGNGDVTAYEVSSDDGAVRPVINVYKSKI